jgi:YQGE family putative transporter
MKIMSFWDHERSLYVQLARKAQALFVSTLLRKIAQPILSVFMNAFLWRESHSFLPLAVYNLGYFFGLTFGFYLNGFLFRFTTTTRLYAWGIMLQSIVVTLLIFTHDTSSFFLLCFGTIYGIAGGIFWANRNFLELNFVADHVRNYYFALMNSVSTLTDILTPFLIGWFIVYGEYAHVYTAYQAYIILALLSLGIIFFAGKKIMAQNDGVIKKERIFVWFRSRLWRKVRLMCFITGLDDGIGIFIGTLIILYFVGNEGALGTLTALSAVITGVILYIVGRKLPIEKRSKVAIVALVGQIAIAFIFTYFYSTFSAIIYGIGIGLFGTLFSIVHDPILYTAIEADDKMKDTWSYARLCDREIFLNAGRIFALLVFIKIYFSFSPDVSLRYAPLAAALSQLPLIFLLPQISRMSYKKNIQSTI